MKFSCDKNLLVSGISIASRTVAQKSSIPALEGIYVRAGMELYLSGYNLETGITVTVSADIAETGTCVMPARLFFDIIRKLPDDEVTISVDSQYKVFIKSGIASFTISAMSAADYPELPDVEYENAIKIPQNKLREMISGTIFSVSENMARPVQTGCLIEVEPNNVTMVAVDGFRLALRRFYPEESLDRDVKFVVPSAALKELEKILGETDDPAAFTLGRKHILFEVGAVTLVCRILEGEFLDWRRVVPENNPILIGANRARLTASIDRVSLIVTEKVKSPVRCKFGKDFAEFHTITTIGEAKDSCELAGDGKDLEIGFNCRYLLDALKAVPSDNVILELSNGLSPIVLTPPDGGRSFLYMVLPVRLKAE